MYFLHLEPTDGVFDLKLLVGKWKTSADNFGNAIFECKTYDESVQCHSETVQMTFPSNTTRSTQFGTWRATYLNNEEIRWTDNEVFKFCWKKVKDSKMIFSENHCMAVNKEII